MWSSVKCMRALVVALMFTGSALAADDASPPEISYVPLTPSIVSNLTGGPKYIRCDIQLMTEDPSNVEEIKLHSPALRHAILMLIAGQDGKQLMTHEGKESLRKAALDAAKSTLKDLTGKERVADLYFTAYYVQ